MNPFEMVVIIVTVVIIGNVLKARFRHGAPGPFEAREQQDDGGSVETARLRDEVQQLKQRIQVLERIAVDKENSLERQIEQLRDR